MKTAFLYAGQGSQRVGMGRDLYAASPAFRKAFDAAELNFDLHALCFDGPQETLNQTQYTQPCMVAFACGVTAALFDAGIRPDYVAGLSLGEYSALEASGVFAAKSAIELAAYRGAAMASASEGVSSAMTAVLMLDRESLARCCEEAGGMVRICDYNCHRRRSGCRRPRGRTGESGGRTPSSAPARQRPVPHAADAARRQSAARAL